jgi:NADH-quinone oxidoreductase subunit C
MNPDIDTILTRLRGALPDATVELRKNPGPAEQHSLLVAPADLAGVCRFLHDELRFDYLSNVTGIDWPDPVLADKVAVPEDDEDSGDPGKTTEPQGFLEVVYHLYSHPDRVGPLVLRVRTGDRTDSVEIPSVVSIWRSAEFQEREIYDLFGVRFTGHPDLRRILMWDEFVDHPMRKDYVAPDDFEYEPTPHAEVLERARTHYPATEKD